MDTTVQIAPIAETLPAFIGANSYSKIIVIVDTQTRRHCYPLVKELLPAHVLITVPNGENHKTLQTCETIWDGITRAEVDRHGLVINIGGGVIGDMGGFCAAVYKRGIDFIQIPTTLLSQVDASVGGKLGIDFNGFKNHLGVFNLPKRVLIDPVFLKTLPERELRSGFAEVIKHCLIADAAKWNEIKELDFDMQNWPDLIAHSVAVKQKVVSEDPTEKGLRKILNFGHTLGHAVETHFLSKPKKSQLLHGEAIAAGMIMEAFLAFKKKSISEQELGEIEEFLFAIYGKVSIRPEDTAAILEFTRQDKKNKGRKILFSLLHGIGNCSYDITATSAEMLSAIEYYQG